MTRGLHLFLDDDSPDDMPDEQADADRREQQREIARRFSHTCHTGLGDDCVACEIEGDVAYGRRADV